MARLNGDDFFAVYADFEKLELIDGEPTGLKLIGMAEGAIAAELSYSLTGYVRQHRLGKVFGADTQLVIGRDERHAFRPDVSFVRFERLPTLPLDDAICRVAPDLAVEIASPSTTEERVEERIASYLSVGTRLVWLVRAKQSTVTVFVPDRPGRVLTAADRLDGGGVLPDFILPLPELFDIGASTA